MHFLKTVTLAFMSVSAASAFQSPSARSVARQAEADYLQARDEYIEKRDIFRRMGGNGTCHQSGTDPKGRPRFRCYKDGQPRRSTGCGPCSRDAKKGQDCLCNP